MPNSLNPYRFRAHIKDAQSRRNDMKARAAMDLPTIRQPHAKTDRIRGISHQLRGQPADESGLNDGFLTA